MDNSSPVVLETHLELLRRNEFHPLIDPNLLNLQDAQKGGLLFVVFILLLSSMTARQGTVMMQSKEISLNAAAQNYLNKKDGEIHFKISGNLTNTAKIKQRQAENEEFAAERENIQNKLITTRQEGQVLMTQTSTNVNIMQQNANEDSGMLKAMLTIFKVIDEMTQQAG